MFALIDENVVVDVVDNKFPVAPTLNWVECDKTVKAGDTYNEGVFIQTKPSVTKQLKLQMLDAEFRNRISQGVAFDGRLFSVTPEDSLEIRGILAGAEPFANIWPGMNVPNVLDAENGPYRKNTYAEFHAWSLELHARVAATYIIWYRKREQLRALSSQEEIDAFDVEVDWT